MRSDPAPRPSLDYRTKLDHRTEGRWRVVLYPDAGEASGNFESAGALPSTARGLGTETAVEAAHRRARGQVRRYCAANRLTYLWTLTYAEGRFDPRDVRRDVRSFFRRLQRVVREPLPYLWVPEWHPGGHGLHLHFALSRYVAHAVVAKSWGRGIVWVRGPRSVGEDGTRQQARRIARYVSKYLTKDVGGGQPARLHRYEVAQGFQPKGIVLTARVREDVLAKAAEAMGSGPSVVWVSSADDTWAGPPAVWMAWE